MSQHTRSQSFSSAGSASSFAALPKDLLDSTSSSTMGDQDERVAVVDPSGTPNPDISAVVRRHHTLGAAGGRLARLERYRQRTIMDLRMDGGEDREGPIIAGDIDGGDGGGVVGKWKRSSASQNNLDNDDIDLLLSPTRSHLRPPMSPSSPTSPTGSSSSNFALVSTSNLHRHTSLPTRRSTARTLWSSRRNGGKDVSPDERAEDEVEMDWGANSGVAGEEEDLGREEHEEGMEWRKGPRRVPGDGLDDSSTHGRRITHSTSSPTIPRSSEALSSSLPSSHRSGFAAFAASSSSSGRSPIFDNPMNNPFGRNNPGVVGGGRHHRSLSNTDELLVGDGDSGYGVGGIEGPPLGDIPSSGLRRHQSLTQGQRDRVRERLNQPWSRSGTGGDALASSRGLFERNGEGTPSSTASSSSGRGFGHARIHSEDILTSSPAPVLGGGPSGPMGNASTSSRGGLSLAGLHLNVGRPGSTSPLKSPIDTSGIGRSPWSPTVEEAARLGSPIPQLRDRDRGESSGSGSIPSAGHVRAATTGSTNTSTSTTNSVSTLDSSNGPATPPHLGDMTSAFTDLRIGAGGRGQNQLGVPGRSNTTSPSDSSTPRNTTFNLPSPSSPNQNNLNGSDAGAGGRGRGIGRPSRKLTSLLPPLLTNPDVLYASQGALRNGVSGAGGSAPNLMSQAGPQSASPYVPPIGHAHSSQPKDTSFVSPVRRKEALNRVGFSAAPGVGGDGWRAQKERVAGDLGAGTNQNQNHNENSGMNGFGQEHAPNPNPWQQDQSSSQQSTPTTAFGGMTSPSLVLQQQMLLHQALLLQQQQLQVQAQAQSLQQQQQQQPQQRPGLPADWLSIMSTNPVAGNNFYSQNQVGLGNLPGLGMGLNGVGGMGPGSPNMAFGPGFEGMGFGLGGVGMPGMNLNPNLSMAGGAMGTAANIGMGPGSMAPPILNASAAQPVGAGGPGGPGPMAVGGVSPIDVSSLVTSKGYNPKTFDIRPPTARFFVIKSYTEEDVYKSLKHEIWSSTGLGNQRLDRAFKDSAGDGPIYLFYSVNASGHFCGMAQMLTPVDYNTTSNVWAQDKWKGIFKVRWIYVRDVPNAALRHIRLANTAENKPVTSSRDTQEVPYESGLEVLRIMSGYQSKTTLLQDFAWYAMQEKQKEFQAQYQQQAGGAGASGGHPTLTPTPTAGGQSQPSPPSQPPQQPVHQRQQQNSPPLFQPSPSSGPIPIGVMGANNRRQSAAAAASATATAGTA